MRRDLEVRLALETIQSVLTRVSTTAYSRNLEELIDLVELALWEPDSGHSSGQDTSPGAGRDLQGRQDREAVAAYWRN
jgi:hypothetical protein